MYDEGFDVEVDHRHPSVSRDYGIMLCMEDLEQCLVWLRRPIPSTLRTNTICAPSSSLILLLSRLPLCLILLGEGLFKLGEAVMHHMPPG